MILGKEGRMGVCSTRGILLRFRGERGGRDGVRMSVEEEEGRTRLAFLVDRRFDRPLIAGDALVELGEERRRKVRDGGT